jgi:hypothetical protein
MTIPLVTAYLNKTVPELTNFNPDDGNIMFV